MHATAFRFPGVVRPLVLASLVAAIAACGGGGDSGGGGGGTNVTPASTAPQAGSGSAEVKSVAAIAQTRDNTLVVDGNGILWSRGSNVAGALGIGPANADVLNLSSKTAPDSTPQARRFVQISSSETHSLALTADGVLWGWGDNSQGQLGIGQDMTPTAMQLATDVVAIAAASSHSLYVTSDGSLFAMGENIYGQLGTGDTDDRSSATLVGTGFAKVATGLHFSAAVKRDGTLWTWGGSERGELGDGRSGRTIRQTLPQQIGTGFRDVYAGSERAFAIRSTGDQLVAWGDNLFGQLGIGKKGNFEATPALVGSGYRSVAAGAGHTLARKTDGTVQAWGSNLFNQLTLGKGTAEALTPTTIAGSHEFIAAGGGNTLLASSNGTMKAYGASFDRPNNDNGNIDFPYDPDAGRENTDPSAGSSGSSGGSAGGSSGGSSGSGGSGGSSGGSRQDALAYDQINYAYACKPVGGIVNRGTTPVSNGPCINEQKAYQTAMGCNQLDANYSFKYVGKPFYQCLVDNSSGDYKSAYQKYLTYFSK